MDKNKNLVSLNKIWDVAKSKNIDKYIKKLDYSDKPDKKYYIINTNNKKIYFGSADHQDYLIHNSNIRRDNFRSRFNKLFEKNKNNIDSGIFWSYLLLW
jgi:hypothetical protein